MCLLSYPYGTRSGGRCQKTSTPSGRDLLSSRSMSGFDLVSLQNHDTLVSYETEAPDAVPCKSVLTAIVQDSGVSQFHGETNGMTKGVVANHDGIHVGLGGRTRDELLLNLRGLDKDRVVVPANLTQHERSRLSILADLNELGVITQLSGLSRVDEAHVGVTKARSVLLGQRQRGVLNERRCERVVPCDQVSVLRSRNTMVVRRQRRTERARQCGLVIPEQDGRRLQHRVTSRPVQVQRHVTTKQPGCSRHDVVKGRIQQELRGSHGLAMLSNLNGELRTSHALGHHADTFNELVSRRQVVVTHEVDRSPRRVAKLCFLDGELFHSENGHRLEQNLFGPESLNGRCELRRAARIGSRGTSN